MTGKRKRSPLDTPRHQASTNQMSTFPEQPPKVEMDQGEQPACSYLGFSCYILPLAIAHSTVSSPTSHACRETYCAEGTGSSYARKKKNVSVFGLDFLPRCVFSVVFGLRAFG